MRGFGKGTFEKPNRILSTYVDVASENSHWFYPRKKTCCAFPYWIDIISELRFTSIFLRILSIEQDQLLVYRVVRIDIPVFSWAN